MFQSIISNQILSEKEKILARLLTLLMYLILGVPNMGEPAAPLDQLAIFVTKCTNQANMKCKLILNINLKLLLVYNRIKETIIFLDFKRKINSLKMEAQVEMIHKILLKIFLRAVLITTAIILEQLVKQLQFHFCRTVISQAMSYRLSTKTIFPVQFKKIQKEDQDLEIVWRRFMKCLQILE